MKADKIIGAVQGVTKKWAKQRKSEERNAAAMTNRHYAMTRRRSVAFAMPPSQPWKGPI